ncbi:MAG TPA: DUF2207 domain-containing protein [Actinomycetes bacterium]|nr:DUF2207 domain-containing protein [Actinomycetes bacterium]
MGGRARPLAAGVGAVLVGALAVLAATPAQAAFGETILSYDVTLTVLRDGDLQVSETIEYDFGAGQRHGIFRDIPTRVPYDQKDDRLYELDDVRVTSPTGAPAGVDRSESAGVTSLRIGDPDKTVTGRHVYDIDYTVHGALNAFEDHDELYWNAIGDRWDVPILAATVAVDLPAAPTQVACFAGYTGSSLPCGTVETRGATVHMSQPGGLGPYSAFTVVAGLPKSAVTATGPILEERWTVQGALTPTPLTGTLAGLILLPGLVLLTWLVATKGRDRRFAGVTPGVVGQGGAEQEPVPVVGAGPVAVQFSPPEGLRPGQMGTLLDERANVLDVTATIVDLAVRGHLRIEEQPRKGLFRSRDWLLVKLPGGKGDLVEYERLLYSGLFQSGDQVLLSSLKQKFAARLARVQSALYTNVTSEGWFRGRPDKVRGRWQIAGVAVAVAGGWLTFFLGRRLHWAPVGIALTLIGVLLFILARRMPARTAKGSAMLAQARGFREYIRTAEAEQLRFEERADIFSRYLPFAVVFGEADRWVKVFGPLAAAAAGTAAASPAWYSGPHGWSSDDFSDSLDGFTSSTSGTIAASTPSSSGGSGFSGGSSGGGGGGGGGGSW